MKKILSLVLLFATVSLWAAAVKPVTLMTDTNGNLLAPTRFFESNLVAGANTTITVDPVTGKATIASAGGSGGSGTASNAVENLNGSGTNTIFRGSGAAKIPLQVIAATGGSNVAFSISSSNRPNVFVVTNGGGILMDTNLDVHGNIRAQSVSGNGLGITNIMGEPMILPSFFGPVGSNDTWILQRAIDFVAFSNQPIHTVYLNSETYTVTNTLLIRSNGFFTFDQTTGGGRRYEIVGPGTILAPTATNWNVFEGKFNAARVETVSYLKMRKFAIEGPAYLRGATTNVNSCAIYIGLSPTNTLPGTPGGYSCLLEDLTILGFKDGIRATNTVGFVFRNNWIQSCWNSAYNLCRMDSCTISDGGCGGELNGGIWWENGTAQIVLTSDINGLSGLGITIARGEYAFGHAFIDSSDSLCPITIIGGTYEIVRGTNFITGGPGPIFFTGGSMNFTAPSGFTYFWGKGIDATKRYNISSPIQASTDYKIFGQTGGTQRPTFNGMGFAQNVPNMSNGGVDCYVPTLNGQEQTVVNKLWAGMYPNDADGAVVSTAPLILNNGSTKLIEVDGGFYGIGSVPSGPSLASFATGLAGLNNLSFLGSRLVMYGPVYSYQGINNAGGSITNAGDYYGTGSVSASAVAITGLPTITFSGSSISFSNDTAAAIPFTVKSNGTYIGSVSVKSLKQPTSADLTATGASFGSNGTNAWVVFRDAAGVLTTNKLSVTTWP